MQPSLKPSRAVLGLLLLCLIQSVQGCAARSIVRSEFIRCEHPLVDASTQGGLYKGLLDYYDAVELCNTLNGDTNASPERNTSATAGSAGVR